MALTFSLNVCDGTAMTSKFVFGIRSWLLEVISRVSGNVIPGRKRWFSRCFRSRFDSFSVLTSRETCFPSSALIMASVVPHVVGPMTAIWAIWLRGKTLII